MRWFIPYNSLSMKQRNVVESIARDLDRRHWVQGFAGSGKSIVLTHLIQRVASTHPNATICFITFTHALKDLVASAFTTGDDTRVCIMTHSKFVWQQKVFDYVFLDEVQDIPADDLMKIKALSRHLYIAGDPDQRIYEKGVSAIDIESIVRPECWKLLEIFRLTRILRSLAVAINPRATIIEGSNAMKIADVQVKLLNFASAEAEASWMFEEALRRARPSDPAVLLFPTHEDVYSFATAVARARGLGRPDPMAYVNGKPNYERFNQFWAHAQVALSYFGNNQGSLTDSDLSPLTYLMTFHSAKGLDFRNVFIPGLREGAKIGNALALEKDPDLARRLLFVAVTRSRENLFLSYSGHRRHEYLLNLPAEVAVEVNPSAQDINEEEIPF